MPIIRKVRSNPEIKLSPVDSRIPLETGALSKHYYTPFLRNKHTVITKYKDVVELGVRDGNYYYLPRGLYPIGAIDNRIYAPTKLCKYTGKFRDSKQEELYNQMCDIIAQGDSFILEAGTGIGKTVLSIACMARFGLITLIVVPKEDLIEQWKAELLAHTDLKESDIGLARQYKCQYEGKKVVIGMLHSLAKDRYPEEFKRYFSMVIFDEIHRCGAETFSIACGLYPAKIRLGLSAGIARSDGKEFIFQAHLGNNKLESSIKSMQPKVIIEQSSFHLPSWAEEIKWNGTNMGLLYKLIGQDYRRNRQLINIIKKAYSKDRRIVVFSHTIDTHLKLLYDMLAETIPESEIGWYIGGMKKKELEEHRARPIVLATYKMCKEGTNVPEWDTCIMGMPLFNIVQTVGRVTRKLNNKKQPVVYDLVDGNIGMLKAFAKGRRDQYKELNATIIEVI